MADIGGANWWTTRMNFSPDLVVASPYRGFAGPAILSFTALRR
jgi:hypothetical protein